MIPINQNVFKVNITHTRTMSENIKTKQPEGRHRSIIFMARVSPEGYYLR